MSDGGEVLHVTNGDCAVSALRNAGISGEYLPWNDALHLGPIPDQIKNDEFSRTRAQFLADFTGMKMRDILRFLEKRNATLLDFKQFSAINLWFEHDLYDQLQLMQIIAMLYDANCPLPIYLFQSNTFLNELSISQLTDLSEKPVRLEAQFIQRGYQIWSDVRHESPVGWQKWRCAQMILFKHIPHALQRLAEEFPSRESGLSRSENQILMAIQNGKSRVGDVFRATSAMEEATFAGDLACYYLIDRLAHEEIPLIKYTGSEPEKHTDDDFMEYEIELTEFGQACLDKKADRIKKNGINRWVAGTHVKSGNLWRWDAEKAGLMYDVSF